MKSLMAVNTLGVVLVNDEKEKQAIQLRKAAVKAKRQFTQAKKQELIDSLPEAPVMLSGIVER